MSRSPLRAGALAAAAGPAAPAGPTALAAPAGLTAMTILAGLGAAPAWAQEDFRQSEADRPLLVEDAYSLKLREWEVELGLRGTVAEEGSALAGKGELKAGLFMNAQVGLELEAAVEGEGPGSEAGLETVGAHLLYNFNREAWSWPAFAARADVRTPGTGAAGREDWSAVWKGIATRSFGRLRLHANGGYAVASDADGGDHWLAGLGFDFPVGLFSRAVLGDVFVEIPEDEGRTRVWLEAGSRWQVTNRSVLDFGLSTRLDEWERGRANVALVLGISRIVGPAGLTPTPPYPNPRLD